MFDVDLQNKIALLNTIKLIVEVNFNEDLMLNSEEAQYLIELIEADLQEDITV